MTEDPIRDSRNWFSYCDNSPVNFVDSVGLCKVSGTGEGEELEDLTLIAVLSLGGVSDFNILEIDIIKNIQLDVRLSAASIYAERKRKLMEIQDITRKHPNYQRGVGIYSSSPKDLTCCNLAGMDDCAATGVHIEYITRGELRTRVNANKAAENMAISAKEGKLKNVSSQRAHELVSKYGYTVMGVWENPEEKGHFVTARPSDKAYDPAKGPYTSNVGWDNELRYAFNAFGVGDVKCPKLLEDIKWYYDPRQTFKYDITKTILFAHKLIKKEE